MKLNAKAMDILMAELQQNQMWVIFLMGLGKAIPATVTRFDLTKIIAVLCKHLNWIEDETRENFVDAFATGSANVQDISSPKAQKALDHAGKQDSSEKGGTFQGGVKNSTVETDKLETENHERDSFEFREETKTKFLAHSSLFIRSINQYRYLEDNY